MRAHVLLLAGLAAGCGSDATTGEEVRGTAEAHPETRPQTGAWFEECARERGLLFEQVSGHDGRHLFPEIMGGGAALVDLDGDADLDAYLVQSGSLVDPATSPPNQLFRNDGTGRFEDTTDASGAGDRGYGMGVAAGDVDGDGDTDLYVTNVGRNVLLSNRGDAVFVDRTDESGVGEERWSVSAAFFDAENDGDLDLFVVNYVFWSVADEIRCRGKSDPEPDYCSPKSYDAPAPDAFYRNDGAGRFEDASAAAGIRSAFGNGLGVVCSDFDRDGWTDVFVANDGTVNQLWQNAGDGRFRDVASARGVALDEHGTAKAGMGVTSTDVDDDGDEDLLVVNLASESDSFYRNDGSYFSDRTAVSRLAVASRPFTRFGVGLLDFDLDGHLDLYEANGRVVRDEGGATTADPYAEPNLLFRGVEGPRFEEVLPRGGTAREQVATSRAAAFGDVDGDGAIDVLVVNRDGPAHLFRNTTAPRGRWIALRPLGPSGSVELGATLRIRAGDDTFHRVARSAYGYASASDPAVHLGLGDRDGVGEVLVRWCDGSEERFGPFAAGESFALRRGGGSVRRDGAAPGR